MYIKHLYMKDRRRSYRAIRRFLGSTDYRQDLKEVQCRLRILLLCYMRSDKAADSVPSDENSTLETCG